MKINEQTITVNGLATRYYEAGSGNTRTLLLLHGRFGDAHLHWAEIMPVLADEFHLIAPDLPGYGGSAPLPALSLEAFVDWTQSLLDALNIEQAAVVGSSFGGTVARLLATMRPTYVPALILVNGGGLPRSARRGAVIGADSRPEYLAVQSSQPSSDSKK